MSKADYDERKFYQDRSYRVYPALRQGQSAFIPHLLRSGVFALKQASGMVRQSFPVHCHNSIDVLAEGQEVRYSGPRLWQYHKRILLALISMASMKVGEIELSFHAEDLLGLMGRDAHTTNVEALISGLHDLRAGTFTVRHFTADRGEVFGCISDAQWHRRQFTVTMDRRCAQALDFLSPTFIPLEMRNRLSDGLQTAIADLVFASRVDLFQIAPVASIWGREPVQFGRDLTPVLPRLQEHGILESYQRMRGQFRVQRAHWFKSK